MKMQKSISKNLKVFYSYFNSCLRAVFLNGHAAHFIHSCEPAL